MGPDVSSLDGTLQLMSVIKAVLSWTFQDLLLNATTMRSKITAFIWNCHLNHPVNDVDNYDSHSSTVPILYNMKMLDNPGYDLSYY